MFFTRLTLNPVWRSFNDMQHEVNRIFDRWGHHPFGLGEYPAVNLRESDDALHLEAELPGFELADLEIFVTGHNELTIKGQRKAPTVAKSVTHLQERPFGKFERTITLPFQVNEQAVEAHFEHGVLNIRLPKHESAKARRIEIKS